MRYICKCGNESSITWNRFKNNPGCISCSNNQKLTYEYVSNYESKL